MAMLYRAHGMWKLAWVLLPAIAAACEPERPHAHEDADLPVQIVDASGDLDAPSGEVDGAQGDDALPDRTPSDEPDAGLGAPEAGTMSTTDASSDSDADLQPIDATVQLDGTAGDGAATDTGGPAPDSGPLDASMANAHTDTDAATSTSASAKQLVAGRAHACSLDPAISGLLCWGDNRAGQTRVPLLSAPVVVAAGGDVTCVIERDGDVRCWGDRTHGQLDVPLLLGRATQVAVGDAHVCALTASGVRCWGDNAQGQLNAPALTGVRSIGAGARHSCALTDAGVRCWGDDAQGQSTVPALSSVSALAVGGSHNCVIAQGTVQCWGGGQPALLTPPSVNGPTRIAAGMSHSCVIDSAGARCWGDAAARDLTPRELTWPQQLVIGGAGERAFACARHLQGVTCWGDDTLRQTAYDGSPYHLLYRAQSDIEAPSELVWSILMDLPQYPQWNPYTIAMRSTLRVGDPMIMTVKMNDLITIDPQTEHIRVLEPGHKVCWGIQTDTPALNSGERCQWLEPLPAGGTRYVTEDLIEGTLNPLVQGLFGSDVQRGFEAVARALKTRAEALAKP